MLKKLLEFLPVSRQKYTKGLQEVSKVIEGLIEAEANHCQIEVSIIQQLQKNKVQKTTKKTNNDPAFM